MSILVVLSVTVLYRLRRIRVQRAQELDDWSLETMKHIQCTKSAPMNKTRIQLARNTSSIIAPKRNASIVEADPKMIGVSVFRLNITQFKPEQFQIPNNLSLPERINPRLYQRELGSSLYSMSHCRKAKKLPRYSKFFPDYSVYNVSLVTVGSMSRMSILPLFVGRWNGPLVLVMHIKEEEEALFLQQLQNKEFSAVCSSRITLLYYLSLNGAFFYYNYPINILRNIGIRHTKTSHYLYVDIDIWMSQKSYEELMNLPKVITSSNKTAVMIPIYFQNQWVIADGNFSTQVASVVNRIPFSISDLTACVHKHHCVYVKKGTFTHHYLKGNWISSLARGAPTSYFTMSCWVNKYQEPYVMVRRNDSLTFYLESLYNYGYNKIVYIELLRYHLYQFVIAGKVFGFDLPHLPSKYSIHHKYHRRDDILYAYQSYIWTVRALGTNREGFIQLCKMGEYALTGHT